MKKLLTKVMIFLSILVLFDQLIGRVLENWYFDLDTGTSGALINHLAEINYDVYIMGASAAQHGYVPDIIEAEVGMPTYNAGEDATSIFYKYAILQLILKRNKPKVILWDISDIDYFFDKHYTKVNLLRPYRKTPHINRLLVDIDFTNSLTNTFRMLPYNQKVAAIIAELLKSPSERDLTDRGYIPLHDTVDLRKYNANDFDKYLSENLITNTVITRTDRRRDLLAKQYFNLFIDECRVNGIFLIAFVSPRCPANTAIASTTFISEELIAALQKKGVPLHIIIPASYPELNDCNLYKDLSHLNHQGAQVYSRIVGEILKSSIMTSDHGVMRP